MCALGSTVQRDMRNCGGIQRLVLPWGLQFLRTFFYFWPNTDASIHMGPNLLFFSKTWLKDMAKRHGYGADAVLRNQERADRMCCSVLHSKSMFNRHLFLHSRSQQHVCLCICAALSFQNDACNKPSARLCRLALVKKSSLHGIQAVVNVAR